MITKSCWNLITRVTYWFVSKPKKEVTFFFERELVDISYIRLVGKTWQSAMLSLKNYEGQLKVNQFNIPNLNSTNTFWAGTHTL